MTSKHASKYIVVICVPSNYVYSYPREIPQYSQFSVTIINTLQKIHEFDIFFATFRIKKTITLNLFYSLMISGFLMFRTAPPPVRPKEEQPPRRPARIPMPQQEQDVNVMRAVPKKDTSEINLSRIDIDLMEPPPPPPLPPPLPPPPPPLLSSQERVIVKPIPPTDSTAMKFPHKPLPLTSVKSYTIASLQQYTNSFSQDNLIGSGMLGTVYRAELPNGKV